ncbi:Nicotianamine synthase [Hesseltinella vesiculosa]|uniref:Nicotianamine synthase n=1 Tax=Hesseltinella vesiculosa TaxID=101127 RepID=A0A1X2GLQ7_9FUNG|nr:Nicotianamine synthase [Hesseltinella vesiculosa]
MVHHLPSPAPMTPIPSKKTETGRGLIQEINRIHRLLQATADLSPSEHTNALFTRLVQLSIMPVDEEIVHSVLQDKTIRALQPSLQSLCSTGECLLEKHWATRLMEASTGKETTGKEIAGWQQSVQQQCAQFVYYQNYMDLARLEYHALMAVQAKVDHVAFIGSGPLPLSSIELLRQHPESIHRIDNIDMDCQANSLATALTHSHLAWPAQISHRLRFFTSDACSYDHYSEMDVVFLGALVLDRHGNKLNLIESIAKQMKPRSHLLIRSAHGLRQLLYSNIRPSLLHTPRLSGLLELVLEVHPHHDIVNSVLIVRRI